MENLHRPTVIKLKTKKEKEMAKDTFLGSGHQSCSLCSFCFDENWIQTQDHSLSQRQSLCRPHPSDW